MLRVKIGASESAPTRGHTAYCAVEITDSSLRDGNGPVSESKAGQVFCGDARADSVGAAVYRLLPSAPARYSVSASCVLRKASSSQGMVSGVKNLASSPSSSHARHPLTIVAT